MMEIPTFPELQFDERKHIYTVNGMQLPSVTTLMRPLSSAYYGGIDESVLANAGKRGTGVHQGIENYLTFGIIDVPTEHKGYFEAFLLWLETEKPNILTTEGRVYHRILRYAGTADLICFIQNGMLTCIDFKTSSQIIEMLVRVQLEAYAKAYESHGLKFAVKQVVHLQKDGGYTVKGFHGNDNEAWEVFCGLLTVDNYLKQYRR